MRISLIHFQNNSKYLDPNILQDRSRFLAGVSKKKLIQLKYTTDSHICGPFKYSKPPQTNSNHHLSPQKLFHKVYLFSLFDIFCTIVDKFTILRTFQSFIIYIYFFSIMPITLQRQSVKIPAIISSFMRIIKKTTLLFVVGPNNKNDNNLI